jgi:hypothetical protein
VTEAIFGLIGVLIGGLIAAATTFAFERRAGQLRASASARLLEDDLETTRSHLDAVSRKQHSDPKVDAFRKNLHWARLRRQLPAALEGWERHRPVLAETLDRKDWDTVAASYRLLEREQEWIARNVTRGTRSFELERIDEAIRVVKTVADREPRSWRLWS